MTAVLEYLDEVEIDMCLRLNRLGRRRPVCVFFSIVSKLGNGGFWVAMCAVLFATQGSRSLPAIAVIAAAAGIGIAIYRLLKNRLVRERPFITHRAIECGTAPLDRYSFPSGHTLHAVSFSIMLTGAEPLFLVPSVTFAGLVAASRLVLGLHYPSDVLAGGAIGAAIGSAGAALL